MASKTGVIRFNVKERFRKHRGQDRNFDTVALAQLVNGPAVQEKVKHGDMVGYLGHWPRVKFGMNPAEGGIVDGKAVWLEPAIRTISITAQPDGTIDHEVEFLDTAPGKMAARMYGSKMGGFSSAIDTRRVADKQIPTGFYGFDYVYEPNFTKNRGWAVALDGVWEDESVLDAIAEQQEMISVFDGMFDSVQRAYDNLQAALDHALLENEQLISMLAKQDKKNGTQSEVVLDGLFNVVHGKVREHKFDSADDFLTEQLAGIQAPPKEPDKALDGVDNIIQRRFR